MDHRSAEWQAELIRGRKALTAAGHKSRRSKPEHEVCGHANGDFTTLWPGSVTRQGVGMPQLERSSPQHG